MTTCRVFAVLFSLLFVISCGKRTDPVPKSSLGLTPPSKSEARVTDAGVLLVNPDSKNPLVVFRATLNPDTRKPDLFRQIGKIEPKGKFLDTGLTAGSQYVYHFRTLLVKYNLLSEPYQLILQYTPTVRLAGVSVELRTDGTYVSWKPNPDIRSVRVHADSTLLMQTAETSLRLPDGIDPDATIVLTPVDILGYAGYTFTLPVQASGKAALRPVSDLRIMHNQSHILITWGMVPSATAYNIYLLKEGQRVKLETSEYDLYTLPMVSVSQCNTFGVTAVRGTAESDIVSRTFCLPDTP